MTVLVLDGEADKILPYGDSEPVSAKLLKSATLETYKGVPHGMPTTQAETRDAQTPSRSSAMSRVAEEGPGKLTLSVVERCGASPPFRCAAGKISLIPAQSRSGKANSLGGS